LAERKAQYSRMMPRALEFLGSGVIGSDYLDAIVKRGHERVVMTAFADELTSRGFMLQLSQLRSTTSLASELAVRLQDREWAIEETKINICPFIDLTNC